VAQYRVVNVSKALKLMLKETTIIRFVVKFYMPDPSQLEEEYTRYLAALQVSP
jgi:hypothetical protein